MKSIARWLLWLVVCFVAIGSFAEEKVDVETIERIKAAASEQSQVMEWASWLTDVYGPRLTGSPNTRAAGEWAMTTMRSWGLSNVQMERWTPPATAVFPGPSWELSDRSWTNERFAFHAVKPFPFNITAVPAVWSPSTNGCIEGTAVRVDVHSFNDLKHYAGRLRDAFLLIDPPRTTPPHFEPLAERLSAEQLAMLDAGKPLPFPQFGAHEHRYDVLSDPDARKWLATEGAAVLLFTAPGDGGNIFMDGPGGGGFQNKDTPDQIPIVKVSAESYGRIARIVSKNVPVTLELDMQNTFYDDPFLFNVIAEIPGTDPRIKDEVVMIARNSIPGPMELAPPITQPVRR